MRLSSPSASAFSSQASRSLELAPRVAFRGSAFAGCASAAAPTLTLMSIPVSRSVAVERSLACFAARSIPSARANARQRKSPAQTPGAIAWNATDRLEARHHGLETQQVGQRLKFPPLVVAEAHDQRKTRRFESFDIHLAHVDRSRATAALRLGVLHLAQFGFDRRPIALLLRRQVEPSLDAGELRIVEHRIG